jgi:hypothetical protein
MTDPDASGQVVKVHGSVNVIDFSLILLEVNLAFGNGRYAYGVIASVFKPLK